MRRLIRERVVDEDLYRIRNRECALEAWWYRLRTLDRRYLLRCNGVSAYYSVPMAAREWHELPEEQQQSLPVAATTARYALAIPMKDGTI